MTILGIGPLLAGVGIGTAIAIVAVDKLAGIAVPIPSPWSEYAFALGIILTVPGLFFWISSGLRVKRAFGSHELITRGVFAISRNPMYAGFILFIIPGIALIVNNLLLIAVSMAMYVAFKARIGREEEFLAGEFGEAYENYSASVPQLVPFTRRSHGSSGSR